MAGRFVFEQVLHQPITSGKRPRPSAGDGNVAKNKNPKKNPHKNIAASSASSQRELEALRGALASAKVLLRTKEAEETASRRRVVCHML